MHFLGKWLKNILWLLFGIIVFMMLIGMMKYGGAKNYVQFLNDRDWNAVRSGGSITSIFWETTINSTGSVDIMDSGDENMMFSGTEDVIDVEEESVQDEFDGYFQEIENSMDSTGLPDGQTGSLDLIDSGEMVEEDGFGFEVPEDKTGYIQDNKEQMIDLMKQREIRDEIAE